MGANWIKFPPGCGDLLVSDEAETVLMSIHTTRRTVDFLLLFLPPARGFLYHLLGLQGVYAIQPANPGLVKCGGVGGIFWRSL
jgi:hypothetical protein